MEASRVTFRGADAHRFAERFLESKAEEARTSINRRGVRNVHTFGGDGFRLIAYERGSSHDSSWLQVSVLVEEGEETCTVVVLVGGGGRGPFKFEEVNLRRLTDGEGAVGEAGRFASVLRDVKRVGESLGLTVDTEWESDAGDDLLATLERKIFDA
jgi:hypothetical protein